MGDAQPVRRSFRSSCALFDLIGDSEEMTDADAKEVEEKLAQLSKQLADHPSEVEELVALLDEAEKLLSRVHQFPSTVTDVFLYPTMKALIDEEILGHDNMDVKVYLAGCFSQISRITAPEFPYNDVLMREIFQLIVCSFENLDDASSRSYHKRVSILQSFAKFRSFIMMLDLEFDDLVVEMFKHFLKAVRSDYPDNIYSAMKTIMEHVIEQSDDISSELLSCLLTSVKMDSKDHFPAVFKLGEEIISCCSENLKPYLTKLTKSVKFSSVHYSNIIFSICQRQCDGFKQPHVNDIDECMMPEYEVDSMKAESTTYIMPETETCYCDSLSVEDVDSEAAKSDSLLNHFSTKSAVRIRSLVQTPNEAGIDGENAQEERRRKLHHKAPYSCPVNDRMMETQEDLSLDLKGNTELQVSLVLNSKKSHAAVDTRQGQPLWSKAGGSDVNLDGGLSLAAIKRSVKDTPHMVKEQDSGYSGPTKSCNPSNKRETRHSMLLDVTCKENNGNNVKKSAGDSSNMGLKETDSASEGSFRKKIKNTEVNENKSSGKEKFGRQRKMFNTVQKFGEDNSSPKISATPKELDDSLVGSRIKVWWPIDRRFYDGTVQSFRPRSKKHVILYDDSDTEILQLKNEHWKLIEDQTHHSPRRETSSRGKHVSDGEHVSDGVYVAVEKHEEVNVGGWSRDQNLRLDRQSTGSCTIRKKPKGNDGEGEIMGKLLSSKRKASGSTRNSMRLGISFPRISPATKGDYRGFV